MTPPRTWTILLCECGGVLRDECGHNGGYRECDRCGKDDYYGEKLTTHEVTVTELAPVIEALRYIAGEDVAGWESHIPPQEVARSLLSDLSPSCDGEDT